MTHTIEVRRLPDSAATAQCSCGWGRPTHTFGEVYELAKNHAVLWGGTLTVGMTNPPVPIVCRKAGGDCPCNDCPPREGR